MGQSTRYAGRAPCVWRIQSRFGSTTEWPGWTVGLLRRGTRISGACVVIAVRSGCGSQPRLNGMSDHTSSQFRATSNLTTRPSRRTKRCRRNSRGSWNMGLHQGHRLMTDQHHQSADPMTPTATITVTAGIKELVSL